jgi:hypothetical protein
VTGPAAAAAREPGTGAAASLVVRAFDHLAGDPTSAVAAATRYSSAGRWVLAQSTQVGVVGGAAVAIPGLHLAGLAADVVFLMHKLSATCWGIGEIQGCVVLGKEDFANILALWSGAATLEELDRRAISKASFEALVIAGGGTLAGLTAGAIAARLTGQQLVMLGGRVAGAFLARQTIGKGAGKAGAAVASQVGGKLGGKLSAKVAAKAGAKLSAKLGAKAIAGSLFLVGPAVGAGVNVHFTRQIAKAAIRYYDAAL